MGQANLAYDAAGNLTADRDGYSYQYDYENRIVRIAKGLTNIAEFTYDALGRRIKKTDCVDANNTRLYYYNDKWQVMCEYTTEGSVAGYYIYGNYIDEVLCMYGPGLLNFVVHDHLYSPVALIGVGATVLERYEYDAYGNCRVLEPNFADDPDGKSDYDNPYFFTGRRVDMLDGGALKIQYNRNRYYDYYMGRWFTQDPIGYVDGLNLYEYVKSGPTGGVDPFGFSCWTDADGIMHCQPTDPTDPHPPSDAPECSWVDMGRPHWDEMSEWVTLWTEVRVPGRRRAGSWPMFAPQQIWPIWRNPGPGWSNIVVGQGCTCKWEQHQYSVKTCCRNGRSEIVDSRLRTVDSLTSRGFVQRNPDPRWPFRCSCKDDYPARWEPPTIGPAARGL